MLTVVEAPLDRWCYLLDVFSSVHLTTLIMVCLLGAMSPGPSLAVILGVATQHGVRGAILASWAHALGVALWASLSLCGWQYTLEHAPKMAQVLTVLASIYLIYLAILLILGLRDFEQSESITIEEDHQILERHHAQKAALSGLMISISNPKLLIFFTTIYPQVIPHKTTGMMLIIAILIPMIIDGAWYHFIATISARMGLLKVLERHRKSILLIHAVLFFFIASQGIWQTITHW